MGDTINKILDFLTQDIVIIITACVACVALALCLFFSRRNHDNNGDDMHTYDLVRLITSCIELVLYAVLIPLIITKIIPERAGGFVTLGLLAITVATEIIEKEPIFMVLWKIPTWALFFGVNAWADATFTGYTAYIGPGGDVSIVEDKPWILILIVAVLAFFLFLIKAIIIIFYCCAAMLGNIILSCGPKQIFYGINLHRD